jgi:hypothetical protein
VISTWQALGLQKCFLLMRKNSKLKPAASGISYFSKPNASGSNGSNLSAI